jgi:hypothetical protein
MTRTPRTQPTRTSPRRTGAERPGAARRTPRVGLAAEAGSVSSPAIGVLAAWSPGEPLRVRLGRRTVEAETTVELSGAAWVALSREGARVLVSFVDGDPDKPIVTGVLRAVPRTIEVQVPLGAPEHARVDGRRVTLTGRDEIVLSCGEASITLRRNGRLVLRGTAVETASRGVNRIKGGSVQIN